MNPGEQCTRVNGHRAPHGHNPGFHAIAEVLADATGVKLEAMALPQLLEAAPAKKARGR